MVRTARRTPPAPPAPASADHRTRASRRSRPQLACAARPRRARPANTVPSPTSEDVRFSVSDGDQFLFRGGHAPLGGSPARSPGRIDRPRRRQRGVPRPPSGPLHLPGGVGLPQTGPPPPANPPCDRARGSDGRRAMDEHVKTAGDECYHRANLCSAVTMAHLISSSVSKVSQPTAHKPHMI